MSTTSWCGVLVATQKRTVLATVKKIVESARLFTSVERLAAVALAKTGLTLIRFEPLDEDGGDFDALLDDGRVAVRALARELKTPVWVLGQFEGSDLDVLAFDATGKLRWKGRGDEDTARKKSTQGRLDDDLQFTWKERVDSDGKPMSRPVWRQQVHFGAPAPEKTTPAPGRGRASALERLREWKATLGAANAELFADGSRRLRRWHVPSSFALRLELGAMALDVLPEKFIERCWADLDPNALVVLKLEELEGELFLHVSETVVTAIEALAAKRGRTRAEVLVAALSAALPPAP